MLKEAEFEVGLDANEATLRVIQEQLESDSPLWQTEGAHKYQRLARDHFRFAATDGAHLLTTVVALLEAESGDVRSAAAAAAAEFAVDPEGREILRREGALRPLVLLVEEGIESAAAEQAAKALMTLAASEINKNAIRQADAIPALLGLLKSALTRNTKAETSKSSGPVTDSSLSRSPRDAESVRGRPNCLNKPAAAYTAGAIMNLQMNAENRIALEQAGALELFQAVLDSGVQNVAIDRVDYILTWLKVGADQDDFRAPGGEKTFEELLHDSHLTSPRDGADADSKSTVGTGKGAKAGPSPAKAASKIKAKKASNMREPDFTVRRPWGGFHTAA